MENIRYYLNKLIYGTFSLFIFITLINALQSDNLKIENISSKVLLVLIISIISFSLIRVMKKKEHDIFNEKIKIMFLSIIFLFIIILQIKLVMSTHPKIGFDVGKFYNQIVNGNSVEKLYFSMYPNNLLLLLLQKNYLKVIGDVNEYFLSLDLLNIVLVDLSAMLNLVAVYIIGNKYLIKGMLINIVWLMLFPMVLVPYSDTMVMPLVSLLLCVYIIESRCSNYIYKCIYSILMGFIIIFIYFIKPSAIIPIISIVICTIFFKKINFQRVILSLLLLTSLFTFYTSINFYLNKQTYIKIDVSRKVPVIHFINIGMKGDRGAYDGETEMAISNLKPQEKIEYSKKSIINTLKSRGPVGYLKFLLMKQGYNTADGSLGWLQEGNFIISSSRHKSNIFKEYLYPDGKYLSDFKFVVQIIWIVALSILLLGFNDRRYFVQVLRLSLIGAFVFLLIFEGGRSRYMIQFLPAIIMLITLLWDTSMQNLKRINDVLFNKENIISD